MLYQGTSEAPKAVAYLLISKSILLMAVHGTSLPSTLARQRHQEQTQLPMAPETICSPLLLLLNLPMVFTFNPLGHFIGIQSSSVPYGYPSSFCLLGEINGSFVRQFSLKACAIWEGRFNVCVQSFFFLSPWRSIFLSIAILIKGVDLWER